MRSYTFVESLLQPYDILHLRMTSYTYMTERDIETERDIGEGENQFVPLVLDVSFNLLWGARPRIVQQTDNGEMTFFLYRLDGS